MPHPYLMRPKESQMNCVIEKNVPMPGRKTGVVAVLRSMEIGDSFIWTKQRSSISNSIAVCKPMRYTTRAVEGGVRVWRVA
jgi:hypothetical protein